MNAAQKVDDLETRARNILRNEKQGLAEKKGNLLLSSERLVNLFTSRLQNHRAVWDKLSVALHSLSPLNILRKGYALVWKDGGLRLVRKIEEVMEDDTVIVSLHKGEFQARVQSVDRDRLLESRFLKEGS